MNLQRPVRSWLFILLSLVLWVLMGFADDDIQLKKINDALQRYSFAYPQQKPYLHIDKTSYRGGEHLWVKAYLLNGLNHIPDTLSSSLYVELISPSASRVEIKRFQMFHGFGIGDFRLSDTLPEGLYQLRAYTNWMQNFDVDFYYKRNFRIVNPFYSKLISPKQARINQKEIESREKRSTGIDLQFMPEGGSLVEGIESEVGFKAVNKLGRSVDTEGRIVDDKGRQMVDFKSFFKGIGTFPFTPETDRKYFAILQSENKEIRIPLPEPLKQGIVMHVANNPGNITISIRGNRPQTQDRSANEIILVGQIGGKVYYQDVLFLENNKLETTLEKRDLPSGVMQITAFSGRGEPLAERLIFNNRFNLMKIGYTATDTMTDKGSWIKVSLRVADNDNTPLPSNLSLSLMRKITPEGSFQNENIISYYLLSSDVKGYIEDPYVYFADNTPFMQKALDNLMMTQGWRRFDWGKILAGEYPKIEYHEEKGIAVYGQITRDFFGIPLRDSKVQLSILNAYNDVFTQYTNEKGYFLFDNLTYFDTINVKIEAWRQNGRRNLLIIVPGESENAVSGLNGDFSLITESERDNRQYRIEKNDETKIALEKENELKAEERKDELQGIYSEADFVLRSEEFPKGIRDALEVMKGRVPGVMISGNSVIIRGPSSLIGNNQPLFLIDGVPTRDAESIRSIPIEQIDRIEVLKGPSAAIYGLQGANGVIAVYTKRGHYMIRGVLEFDMLGYNTPKSFYQPRYLPANEPAANYTLVWEPVIITDNSGKTSFMFEKPRIKGDYHLVIEGVSYLGHVGLVDEMITNE